MKVVIKGNPIIKGIVREDAEIQIPVPAELQDLALQYKGDGVAWDQMCKRLPSFGFMNPIGKMSINYLVIDGVEKVFH